MDSKTGLDSKILLWLAGELGWIVREWRGETRASIPMASRPKTYLSVPLDLEADTPEGARLREKVVEWLAHDQDDDYSVAIVPAMGRKWTFESDAFCEPYKLFDTKGQTIIAAVKWLYEREVDHD